MKIIFSILAIVILSFVAHSQDVPSQQKLEESENTSIMMYLKVASMKYDSLVRLQQFIQYAEQESNKIRAELMFLSGEAEKEMLRILERNGYNPDLYTIMIKRNDKGEIELHVVKKSDLPEEEPSIGDSKMIK